MSLVNGLSAAFTRIGSEIKALRSGKVSGLNGLASIWKGTQAEYNALGSKSETTVYLITG